MRIKTKLITNHVKENITVYIFMTTLFLIGVIFGAMIVNSMTFIQKEDLFFHLDKFYQSIRKDEMIASKDIFKQSFFFHIQYLLLFFVLGLTIIGLPIIWILNFLKGLVIGFTVGFIVNQLGFHGLIIAIISIAPHNLIFIPIYIIASSLAMIFSLFLIQKLFVRTLSQSITKPFIQYSMICLILIGFAICGTLIETFISNEAHKAFLKYIGFIVNHSVIQ